MSHSSSAQGVPALSSRFLVIVALFVACLLTANMIAAKLVSLGGMVVSAAIVIFPVSYIIGDVLTEVYGYRRARQVIWLGFLANLLAVVAVWLGGLLPAASFWQDQAAYDTILGATPRILAASFVAFLIGEFSNSYVLAKMKIAMRGRHLWARTIGSTVVGQGLDSTVFVLIAFAGSIPNEALAVVIATEWLLKTAYEAAATPLTYLAIGYLKRAEGVDVYDTATDFNPLQFETDRAGS